LTYIVIISSDCIVRQCKYDILERTENKRIKSVIE